MALPKHIFAPAFRQQHLSWFFAALVGIMVYVATFLMAGEATLSAITFTWDKGIENRMTIELPSVDDEASEPQAERIRQVTALLHAVPDIELVTVVPDDETARLLKPWINQPELLRIMPLPTLIDIERKSGSSLTADDIKVRIKSVVSDAQVDDHGTWLSDMTRLIKGLALLAGLTILMTGLTLIITVSLICRALMATERDTLSLLHTLGAEDKDIAQHFQFHAQRLAWPAAWSGFLCAVVSIGLLLFFFRHFADPTYLTPLHWLGLSALTLLVPLTAIWITAYSARLSTLKLLHAMP